MHNAMKAVKGLVVAGAFMALFLATGCTGRTADNMVPTGETVRVVIPTQDVAQDSAIANGGEVTATPDLK